MSLIVVLSNYDRRDNIMDKTIKQNNLKFSEYGNKL